MRGSLHGAKNWTSSPVQLTDHGQAGARSRLRHPYAPCPKPAATVNVDTQACPSTHNCLTQERPKRIESRLARWYQCARGTKVAIRSGNGFAMKNLYSIVMLLTTFGCASYPPPSDHLASAIAAARVAREAGAPLVPPASLKLKLADEQISQAKQMMQNGDNERADFMTLRAYNDAELALAMVREKLAQSRVAELQTASARTTSPASTPTTSGSGTTGSAPEGSVTNTPSRTDPAPRSPTPQGSASPVPSTGGTER